MNKLFYSINKSKLREGWVIFFASLSLLVSSALISSKKPFWNDELYSWYFLADSSFTSMLNAFGDTINNTPFLYFGLGWLWARVFGASELSLRLFSSLGFCLAFAITWITLRRTFSFWATTIGCLAVFCTSELVISQNAEARMYGLFLLTAAVSLLAYDTILRQEKPSKKWLIANFIAHATMIHTHLFGLFYSGAILCAFISANLLNEFRIKAIFKHVSIYLSIILAWLSFLLYLPAFLVQSEAGKPYSWIPTPIWEDLTSLLLLAQGSFLRTTALILIILFSSLQFLAFKKDFDSYIDSEEQSSYSKKALIIFAFFILGVPIFTWFFSRFARPIFYDRYLIPSILAWSILVSYLAESVFRYAVSSIHSIAKTDSIDSSLYSRFWRKYGTSLLPMTLSTVFLVHPIAGALNYFGGELPGTGDEKIGYKDLPIVVQFSHDFLERRFYSPTKDRYFYILDWEANNTEASGLFGIQEYKHMTALKRKYPELFDNHIVDGEKFLNSNQKFIILDYEDYDKQCSVNIRGLASLGSIHCPQWVEKRLLNNPGYTVEKLGVLYGRAFLLIRKNY